MTKPRPIHTGRESNVGREVANRTASEVLSSAKVVLRRLAEACIDEDIPAVQMEQSVRSAFVAAAAKRAKRNSGTVNRSLISAITGIPRPEVTKLLVGARMPSGTANRTASPTQRLLDGWLSDPRFSTAAHGGRVLSYVGHGNSFRKLVRLYGSDVPPRAMLEQLRRLGVVTVTSDFAVKGGRVKLTNRVKPRAQRSAESLFIGEICRGLETRRLGAAVDARVLQTIVPISDPHTILAALRAAEEKGTHFLNGTRDALGDPTARPALGQLQLIVGLITRSKTPSTKKTRAKGKRKSGSRQQHN